MLEPPPLSTVANHVTASTRPKTLDRADVLHIPFHTNTPAIMPDPKLQAYLASKYLSGPKAEAMLARSGEPVKKKKKKRKADADAGANGLVLKDDEDAWKASPEDEDDEDGFGPQIVQSKSQEGGFKKAKLSSIREGEGSRTPQPEEGKPKDPTPPPAIKAGLRSKEELKAARIAKEKEEKARAAAEAAQQPKMEQETVYRDSSGRRIDIKAEEEERKRLEKEEERKRRERDEWGKGIVQRKEREEQARLLDKMRESKLER